MEAVSIARELWARRRLVGLVAILAIVAGLFVTCRISLMPPGLASRSYDVGVATSRMLVDTPSSQVVAVSPKGSETLGARASLISALMTDGAVKADIARRVRLPVKHLIATAESGGTAQGDNPAPKLGPRSHVLTTRVLTNTVGEQLPIIEIEAQAPDIASATALVLGAVTSLQQSLDQRAASEGVPQARRLRVTALGPPEVRDATRGTRKVLGVAAALFVFAAGCAALVMLFSFARGWREAEASESGFLRARGAADLRSGPLVVLPGRDESPPQQLRSS
jgi:hypothetical protein